MTNAANRAKFLLAGSLAGLASGAMMLPVFGVRGAMLGLALSAGAVVLQARQQRDSAGPGAIFTLLVSLGMATAAWAAILLWDVAMPPPDAQDFDIDRLMPGAAAAGCFLQVAMILLGYRVRLIHARGGWGWFALAPAAGAGVRALTLGGLDAFPFTFFLGSLPFVALWLIAARLCDAAWPRATAPTRSPIL